MTKTKKMADRLFGGGGGGGDRVINLSYLEAKNCCL